MLMKNNIKNIIAFGIVASIMNSSIVPVFATENISTENLNTSKAAQTYTNSGENISVLVKVYKILEIRKLLN